MRSPGASRLLLALLLHLAALPLSTLSRASAQDLVATPQVSAQSAYVFDATSGRVLVELNSDERRPPASTVKIVTAMVVLDHADLATEIVFLAEDAASEEESAMNIIPGDTLTVEQLLVGLLLPSGNDAARTLARHVGTLLLDGAEGDPIARFVEAMNAKVAEAGLSDTRFTSPDGLSDDGQYSTAYDLARLGAMAMEYEMIEETVSQASAVITSVGQPSQTYELTNTNLLLETGETELATEGVVGLKSGSTERAGACLVLAKRQRGGNLVIAVVLGSELAYDEAGFVSVDGRWDDMSAILGSINDEFAWLNPDSMRDVPGLRDELSAWQVRLEDDSSIVVASELASDVRYRLELAPTGSTADSAGRVLFFAGPEMIDERPLVAS